jgi:glucose-1-phosphate cytidylyltransferase
MIEIGGKPILWHIMKSYSAYGIHEFIICCGYRGYVIKEYFANYFMHMSDITFDMTSNTMKVHEKKAEAWSVTLIDTGDETQTGGRLRRVANYLDEDQDFCFTYGDGLANIDISKSIAFHKKHGRLATVAAVRPPGRFGAIDLEGAKVKSFLEKPRGDGALINGGFFVLSPKCLSFIDSDESIWELDPLNRLAASDQLMAYEHDGFWQAMDTLRDRQILETLWASGKAPWKNWE